MHTIHTWTTISFCSEELVKGVITEFFSDEPQKLLHLPHEAYVLLEDEQWVASELQTLWYTPFQLAENL